MQMKVNDLQEFGRSLSSQINPFIIGHTDSPKPMAVPYTPQAVPNRFLSTKRDIELPSTVYKVPTRTLKSIRNIIMAKQSKPVGSSIFQLLGRKYMMIKATIVQMAENKIINLRDVGFIRIILPKISANAEPNTQGMRRIYPVVTQEILKRFEMRSFKFEYMPILTQFASTVKFRSQNKGGSYNRQLALNYYYYSSFYCCCYQTVSLSCLLFYLRFIIQEIIKAAITERKSMQLAMYQGRLIE